MGPLRSDARSRSRSRSQASREAKRLCSGAQTDFGGRRVNIVQVGLGTNSTFIQNLGAERDEWDYNTEVLLGALSETRHDYVTGIGVEPVHEHVNSLLRIAKAKFPHVALVQVALGDKEASGDVVHCLTHGMRDELLGQVPQGKEQDELHAALQYLQNMSSTGAIHPDVPNRLDQIHAKFGLQARFQQFSTDVWTWRRLTRTLNFSGCELLLVDTEGHDAMVLRSMISYCKDEEKRDNMAWPDVIQFESMGLCDKVEGDGTEWAIIDSLRSVGYELAHFSHYNTQLIHRGALRLNTRILRWAAETFRCHFCLCYNYFPFTSSRQKQRLCMDCSAKQRLAVMRRRRSGITGECVPKFDAELLERLSIALTEVIGQREKLNFFRRDGYVLLDEALSPANAGPAMEALVPGCSAALQAGQPLPDLAVEAVRQIMNNCNPCMDIWDEDEADCWIRILSPLVSQQSLQVQGAEAVQMEDDSSQLVLDKFTYKFSLAQLELLARALVDVLREPAGLKYMRSHDGYASLEEVLEQSHTRLAIEALVSGSGDSVPPGIPLPDLCMDAMQQIASRSISCLELWHDPSKRSWIRLTGSAVSQSAAAPQSASAKQEAPLAGAPQVAATEPAAPQAEALQMPGAGADVVRDVRTTPEAFEGLVRAVTEVLRHPAELKWRCQGYAMLEEVLAPNHVRVAIEKLVPGCEAELTAGRPLPCLARKAVRHLLSVEAPCFEWQQDRNEDYWIRLASPRVAPEPFKAIGNSDKEGHTQDSASKLASSTQAKSDAQALTRLWIAIVAVLRRPEKLTLMRTDGYGLLAEVLGPNHACSAIEALVPGCVAEVLAGWPFPPLALDAVRQVANRIDSCLQLWDYNGEKLWIRLTAQPPEASLPVEFDLSEGLDVTRPSPAVYIEADALERLARAILLVLERPAALAFFRTDSYALLEEVLLPCHAGPAVEDLVPGCGAELQAGQPIPLLAIEAVRRCTESLGAGLQLWDMIGEKCWIRAIPSGSRFMVMDLVDETSMPSQRGSTATFGRFEPEALDQLAQAIICVLRKPELLTHTRGDGYCLLEEVLGPNHAGPTIEALLPGCAAVLVAGRQLPDVAMDALHQITSGERPPLQLWDKLCEKYWIRITPFFLRSEVDF